MKATNPLSHGEFFKLCELVRKNKDQLSMNGAVAMLPPSKTVFSVAPAERWVSAPCARRALSWA